MASPRGEIFYSAPSSPAPASPHPAPSSPQEENPAPSLVEEKPILHVEVMSIFAVSTTVMVSLLITALSALFWVAESPWGSIGNQVVTHEINAQSCDTPGLGSYFCFSEDGDEYLYRLFLRPQDNPAAAIPAPDGVDLNGVEPSEVFAAKSNRDRLLWFGFRLGIEQYDGTPLLSSFSNIDEYDLSLCDGFQANVSLDQLSSFEVATCPAMAEIIDLERSTTALAISGKARNYESLCGEQKGCPAKGSRVWWDLLTFPDNQLHLPETVLGEIRLKPPNPAAFRDALDRTSDDLTLTMSVLYGIGVNSFGPPVYWLAICLAIVGGVAFTRAWNWVEAYNERERKIGYPMPSHPIPEKTFCQLLVVGFVLYCNPLQSTADIVFDDNRAFTSKEYNVSKAGEIITSLGILLLAFCFLCFLDRVHYPSAAGPRAWYFVRKGVFISVQVLTSIWMTVIEWDNHGLQVENWPTKDTSLYLKLAITQGFFIALYLYQLLVSYVHARRDLAIRKYQKHRHLKLGFYCFTNAFTGVALLAVASLGFRAYENFFILYKSYRPDKTQLLVKQLLGITDLVGYRRLSMLLLLSAFLFLVIWGHSPAVETRNVITRTPKYHNSEKEMLQYPSIIGGILRRSYLSSSQGSRTCRGNDKCYCRTMLSDNPEQRVFITEPSQGEKVTQIEHKEFRLQKPICCIETARWLIDYSRLAYNNKHWCKEASDCVKVQCVKLSSEQAVVCNKHYKALWDPEQCQDGGTQEITDEWLHHNLPNEGTEAVIKIRDGRHETRLLIHIIPGLERIVVAFQGSKHPRHFVEDAKISTAAVNAHFDFNFKKPWVPELCKTKEKEHHVFRVHRGFRSSYVAVQEQVQKIIRRALDLNPRLQLYITGHSLGGALANLCAFDLATWPGLDELGEGDVKLYTFAAPRCGDLRFKTEMDGSVPLHFAFQARGDPVPQVPRLGYFHAGIPVLIEERPGKKAVNVIVEPSTLETFELLQMSSNVGQHSLKSLYSDALEYFDVIEENYHDTRSPHYSPLLKIVTAVSFCVFIAVSVPLVLWRGASKVFPFLDSPFLQQWDDVMKKWADFRYCLKESEVFVTTVQDIRSRLMGLVVAVLLILLYCVIEPVVYAVDMLFLYFIC